MHGYWILFEKGKLTEARIYIEQAMKNGGDSSQVIVEHCGDIYFKLGEKEKALELWKKALTIDDSKEEGATPRPEKEIKRLKQKIAEKEIKRLKQKIALRKYIE